MVECNGVWGRRDHGQSGSFGGTRICENGHVCAGRAHEWSGEIFFDVSSDRSNRFQEKMHRDHTDGWESVVKNSRYGL